MKKIKNLFKSIWKFCSMVWHKIDKLKFYTFLVWVLFFTGIYLIWYLFVDRKIVKDQTDKITFLISSFGALFGIIQLLINIISNKLTFIKKLRYEEYVKLKEIIDEFSNYIMEDLGNVEKSRYLKGKLYITCREFKARIDTANKYVFPNIASHSTARKVEQNLLLILHEAIGFDMEKDELAIGEDGKVIDKKQLSVLAIKWIKNTNPYMEELKRDKITFFEYVQKFIF
jgi:hypothetical protein